LADELIYQHLVGRRWDYGRQDCFDIGRCFYKDNFGIDIPDYARPWEWWKDEINLYTELAIDAGFVKVDRTIQSAWPGDMFLVNVIYPVPEHGAVYLGNGRILHHPINQMSQAGKIPLWVRKGFNSCWRHKDMPDWAPPKEQPIDLVKLLPPAKRRMIEAALEAAGVSQPND